MAADKGASSQSAQGYQPDPRNQDVLVYVDGKLLPRDKAVVSVFDSAFALGDGVWEGLRLVEGKLLQLEAHLDRLFEGANALAIDIGRSREELIDAIIETLNANKMRDGAHIRLMVSRGLKSTPNQDPRFVIGKATVVIAAEFKTPKPESKQRGLTLFTSTFRTSAPDIFDMRLNTHSRLNYIQALIQAIHAGGDEALMLDPNGFVASCNSTNFHIFRGDELWTSTGLYSFNGLTQRAVLTAWRENGGVVRETDFTLAEVYAADEAFVTGTLGGLTPVTGIDGRVIGDGKPGKRTAKAAGLYEAWVMARATSIS